MTKSIKTEDLECKSRHRFVHCKLQVLVIQSDISSTYKIYYIYCIPYSIQSTTIMHVKESYACIIYYYSTDYRAAMYHNSYTPRRTKTFR